MHGFDTSLIAGHDRDADSFGGVTFTRVLGQAWEIHGEGMWREQAAALLGGKFTLHSGVSFIGEFYTPPNIRVLSRHGHLTACRTPALRLRLMPGRHACASCRDGRSGTLSGSVVANLNDHSYTGVFDVNRWFGNHFSSYLHLEIPHGGKTSDFGAAPYSTATSLGVRFQL